MEVKFSLAIIATVDNQCLDLLLVLGAASKQWQPFGV